MKRRGFLGFVGGAAVAGPSVAKNAVAKLPEGLGLGNHIVASYGIPGEVGEGPGGGDWKIKEIAKLRRLLTGDLTDDEKEERRRSRLYSRQLRISHEVSVLVSVSGVHKLAMHEHRMEKNSEDITRSSLRGRLSRLLRGDD